MARVEAVAGRLTVVGTQAEQRRFSCGAALAADKLLAADGGIAIVGHRFPGRKHDARHGRAMKALQADVRQRRASGQRFIDHGVDLGERPALQRQARRTSDELPRPTRCSQSLMHCTRSGRASRCSSGINQLYSTKASS